ncbi:hypothetical protein A2U01_0003091 [Trifolium medium]|uniref:Uncharacterized protein n=1 Tax=Trifolium medium TaxID=97028 RepID=A0A392M4T8_9FABA|nr:hypothetical protein [Trifolium medium]
MKNIRGSWKELRKSKDTSLGRMTNNAFELISNGVTKKNDINIKSSESSETNLDSVGSIDIFRPNESVLGVGVEVKIKVVDFIHDGLRQSSIETNKVRRKRVTNFITFKSNVIDVNIKRQRCVEDLRMYDGRTKMMSYLIMLAK